MRQTLRLWGALAALALVAAPLLAQTAPAPAKVAAIVNGQPIPASALERAMKTIPDAKRPEARAEILNFLIDNQLIEQHLIAQKITAEPKEVDARLEEMKKQLASQKLDFAKVLQEMMLTEDELRGHIAAEIRWQKAIDQQATEKGLHDLFEQNPEMFDGTMVHARHILLTPGADPTARQQAVAQLQAYRKQVEDAVSQGMAKLPPTTDALAREKERIRITDETFAALAKDKSACPSKERGGDVGFFPRAGAMVEPFARTAFSLMPYQLSDVVATQFGYHLILVTERKPGRSDLKYDEIKDEVREVFAGRLRESLVAQLRQTAKIEIK
jgi:peptidyl-prolyl cis-trans isomerase C